ncbi:dolichyl-phosphate-mannose--protein mannosyltransferase [Polymorphospora rubra]|uniref:dolichyl-phosphate-mannose--protein mannosyltransferase n=1 Tax=Polymorphospora rubra TaxID=338584 RepID=UPI003F4D457A
MDSAQTEREQPDVSVGSASGDGPDDGPDRPARGIPAIVRRRLAPFDARLDPWSWVATGVVVAIAAILRLVGLGHPPGKIFDEIYYARDAWGLVTKGVEWNYTDNVASYVVHPPLGKWLIGLGQWAFGYADTEQNISVAGHLVTLSPEVGWRVVPAIIGTLSVLIMVRTARRLFRSTVLGCAAGLLVALDGFHLVLSRTALLDIFIMFFVFAAFAALVVDRDARRRRWLNAMEAGLDPSRPGRAGRPTFDWRDGIPWWRLLAFVLMGCAVAVKWSALAFVPVFVLMILWWEAGARRSAGVRRPWRDTLLDESGWLILGGVVLALTYLATWTGWFISDEGYYRHWRADSGLSEPPMIGALLNLAHYHSEAYKFHSTLDTSHTYQSWPWQWLLLGRPVAFYWSTDGACGAASCAAEILLLGTPLLWWSFLPAIVAVGWLGIARRDWRAGTILLALAAGLLPWFYYALDDRTMFNFYTAPAQPFLVLAVVYVLGAIIGPVRPPAPAGEPGAPPPAETDAGAADSGADGAAGPGVGRPGEPPAGLDASGAAPAEGSDVIVTGEKPAADDTGSTSSGGSDRRLVGAVIAGVYVLLVAICFAYFHPVFVGKLLPYAEWSARMWLGSRWI